MTPNKAAQLLISLLSVSSPEKTKIVCPFWPINTPVGEPLAHVEITPDIVEIQNKLNEQNQ